MTLSLHEAARRLGVAPSSMYRLVAEGKLRRSLDGKTAMCFEEAELERYIDARTNGPYHRIERSMIELEGRVDRLEKVAGWLKESRDAQ